MARKSSFPPVVDNRVRLIILGSLPGEESLRRGQYYAHLQNRFWELLGGSLGVELRALAYADRLQCLLHHGIGLWDAIADAHRSGSLDSAVRNVRANDLRQLVHALPHLSAIAFNGKKAEKTGRQQLGDAGAAYRLITLPSSSPAYAAMSLAKKQSHWAVIGSIAGKGKNRIAKPDEGN